MTNNKFTKILKERIWIRGNKKRVNLLDSLWNIEKFSQIIMLNLEN